MHEFEKVFVLFFFLNLCIVENRLIEQDFLRFWLFKILCMRNTNDEIIEEPRLN